jgi:CheY-like chemotaxis protein
MTQKIMLVDDDATLLSSLTRNLCFDYDLTTAACGPDALDRLAAHKDFCVIVTDMRMPRMDGVQFIEEARKLAPDSVYMMLTGNQDLQTAMKAVNDGQVFRFLNKPCEIAEIKRALDAALHQYSLIHAEKELLQKTFVGAVNVLTDVLDALRPDLLQQSHRIDTVMRGCEAALGFCGNWAYRMAVRLGLVGLALQPADEQVRFQHLTPADPRSKRLFDDVTETTAKLIERIPRLDPVVAILRSPPTTGAITQDDVEQATPVLGGLLLRIATYWTSLISAGNAPSAALDELRAAFPMLPERVAEALVALELRKAANEPIQVAMEELAEGMILSEDVLSEDGAVLLRSGRRLTTAIIEKLRLHCTELRRLRPIFVFDPASEAVPLAAGVA